MFATRSHRSIGAALLGLWVALGASPGHTAAAVNTTGPIAARATKLFRQGDFARALIEFEKAVTLVERGAGDAALLPVLRFNLARCLEELGRPGEALAAFDRYLEAPDSETARARARERIEALEQRFFARLQVDCQPAVATLSLNGREAGPCGHPLRRVEPGVVEVMARRSDDLVVKETLTLTAGAETRATLTFGARIRVEAPAGDVLQVQVDDVSVAGPPHVVDVRAGAHRVEVRLPDGSPWRREPQLAPGATLVLSPMSAEAVAGRRSGFGWDTPWPWLAFGGAVGAGGLGAWFWSSALDNAHATEVAVDAYNASSDAATRAEARLAAKVARGDTESQRLAAYSLVGTAVALAGVGTFLVWPRSAENGPTLNGVAIGPQGLVLAGQW